MSFEIKIFLREEQEIINCSYRLFSKQRDTNFKT